MKLAAQVGRTASSIAMKLANFASLDPKITDTVRRGLAGASALDREVWREFHQDWTKLIVEAAELDGEIDPDQPSPKAVREEMTSFAFEPYSGPSVSTATIEQRVGQNFFRRAVLANYDVRCAITGIADARLLNASHITPWSTDQANRHNPANGLCLSATFDRAFDRGLVTVLPSLHLKIARCLSDSDSTETRDFFSPYQGQKLRSAARFEPDRRFLEWHNANCFIDTRV